MIYRTALIGCGNIGSLYASDPLIKSIYTHAEAYIKCPRTQLVAVCDLDYEKASNCAKKWDISAVYCDFLKLLEEQKPAIVSICTPDKTHADILEAVLNSSDVRAVIMEKPLALDEHRAQSLVKMARERGIILAVNYSRRYSQGHFKIKEFIQSGKLGDIQTVSGFYTKGLFHNGTHWLDLSRWLVGEIKSVHGFNVREEMDSDAILDAFLIFENGAVGFLQNLNAEAFSLFEMDILGTQGRIRITDSGHKIEYFTVSESPYYSGYKALKKISELDGDMNDTLLNVVNDVVTCLEREKQPICSGLDGVAVLNIAFALVRSAKNSLKINLCEGAT